MAKNSIGSFEFIALQGSLAAPREMVAVDQRPGVNGTELTKLGKKGEPFQMVSQVDAPNYDAARALYLQYLDLVGANPVDLVQGGKGIAGEAYSVAVLGVEIGRISPISRSVGGLNSPSNAFLECLWTLIAV